MNILVTGALGQLGRSIQNAQKIDEKNVYIYTDKMIEHHVSRLDISSPDDIDKFMEDNKIDIIVNCAAYTNVEEAETVSGFSNARNLNAISVKNLAESAKKHGARLIHISTDYVFDGELNRPYRETDMTNPKTSYGITKKEGEDYAMSILKDDCIILRTSWLYSTYGWNFVKTVRKLINENDSFDMVLDEIGSPTYAGDLAWAIIYIIEHWNETEDAGGIYHFSNEGVISRYDFAEAIRDMEYHVMGNDRAEMVEINPCTTENLKFKLKATRPRYSVMSKDKFKKKFGVGIPYWRNSLFLCMDKIRREYDELASTLNVVYLDN